tara:strand:- start:65987 stop:66784 length:798 start_codon:yes stop_codon:yes gene_type:complete
VDTQERIQALSPWFHNIHLPEGHQTAPDHFLGDFPSFKWNKIKDHIPADLNGWKVLDIGCNAGFYSIELAKRGAHVTAIDLDEHYLKQAKWVASMFDLEDRITFKQQQIYDLAHSSDEFDLIWFMGVFYHLRYPLLALDIISQRAKNLMVFQTLSLPGSEEMVVTDDVPFHKREIMTSGAWPSMAFIPNKLAGDPTNWWAPNHQGILSLLKNCGFKYLSMPEDETYLVSRNTTGRTALEIWNRSEYLAATGQEWQLEINTKTKKF